MPIQPPSRQQLEWIADALHMTLTEEELDVFAEARRAGARRATRGSTSSRTSSCP